MNTKFLLGVVVGSVVALGGVWAYKSWCGECMSSKNEASAKAEVGAPAPNFSLVNQNGENIALSDAIETGPVVLEWFNKECPYVKKFYDVGEMQRLQNAYSSQGFTWMRVISSAPGKQGHLNQEEAQMSHNNSRADHTLLDPAGDVGRMYGAKTTPHMYVINGEGVLVYAGAIDSIRSTDSDDIMKAENYVVNALEAIQNGTAIETSVTEPYGCSVKY